MISNTGVLVSRFPNGTQADRREPLTSRVRGGGKNKLTLRLTTKFLKIGFDIKTSAAILAHNRERGRRYASPREVAVLRRTQTVLFGALLCLAACKSTVELRGDRQKPIYVVMDINIRLDRELDKFFDFEDEITAEEKGVGGGIGDRAPSRSDQEETQ
jgi:hypothetical protein